MWTDTIVQLEDLSYNCVRNEGGSDFNNNQCDWLLLIACSSVPRTASTTPPENTVSTARRVTMATPSRDPVASARVLTQTGTGRA